MISDCQNVPLPVYACGSVVDCNVVEGAKPDGSVMVLRVKLAKGNNQPVPGQFYMLHAVRSDVLLARPISVYHSEILGDGSVEIHFMILLKGKGTVELCSLRPDDKINLLGPCGNRFVPADASKGKVLIVGGGIGVAPVAGFAETLPAKTYDFYASFKSGSYGLENIKADKLVITTDDGSVGVHGMLPAALTTDTIRAGNYTAVYACGPTPMLAYVKQVAEEAGVQCWLSMESRMACGVGVCLGCTIQTTEGKKRCCKDGPIFDSKVLSFEKKPAPAVNKSPAEVNGSSAEVNGSSAEVNGSSAEVNKSPAEVNKSSAAVNKSTTVVNSSVTAVNGSPAVATPDLSVTIASVKFQNPLIGSSGTFGFGTEYTSVIDVNRIGGISSKGLTLEPRQGNDGIRLWETPSGLMNSIGLQNPGIPHFIEHELPEMMALKPVAIANLSGSSLETYVEGAKLLDKSPVPMIELNISCPNVSAGGAAFGMTCSAAKEVVKAVRAATSKPLIVKLTPQAPDLIGVAMECINEGADAISLCNSFQGIAIDIERGVPVFEKVKAGVGGPAIRPIAVRLVYELVQAINQLPKEKQVPVIAIGGIATWQDAVEFIMAGATALQVGTMNFVNPNTMIEVIDGLEAFMKRKGYATIEEMRGLIQK